MVFKNEEVMYKYIADWLENRETNPCYYVLTDKPKKSGYDFRFGTKTYYSDVLGAYEKDGTPHFVGIEVKNSAKTTQTSLRQAQALQSFCREVFVAMPEDAFMNLPTQDQEDLTTLINRSQIALLLLDKYGNVTEKIERKLTGFRIDLHNNAEKFIRGISTDEAKLLLNSFLNKRYRRHYLILEDKWKFEDTDDGVRFLHTNSLKKDRGSILFQRECIKVNTVSEMSLILKWWIIEQIEDDDAYMNDAIKKISEAVKESDCFKKENIKLPIWVSFLNWEEEILMKVELRTLSTSERFMATLSAARSLLSYYVKIEVEYNRPLSLVPSTREWDFIDDLREIYSCFTEISNILEGEF